MTRETIIELFKVVADKDEKEVTDRVYNLYTTKEITQEIQKIFTKDFITEAYQISSFKIQDSQENYKIASIFISWIGWIKVFESETELFKIEKAN